MNRTQQWDEVLGRLHTELVEIMFVVLHMFSVQRVQNGKSVGLPAAPAAAAPAAIIRITMTMRR